MQLRYVFRVILSVLAFAFVLTFHVIDPFPGSMLWDLGSFIASGQAATEGQNPYAIYPLTVVTYEKGEAVYGPNLNPPFLLPLFEVLALLDLKIAASVWAGVSAMVYIFTLLLLKWQYPESPPWKLYWALLLAGLWSTLGYGQIYIWFTLIGTVAWLCLRQNREKEAAFLIGTVVAMKPNFILWPLFLWIAGYKQLGLSAMISFTLLSLLPLARYDFIVYQQWLMVLPSAPGIGWADNLSFISLASWVGFPVIGVASASILLVTLMVWLWRQHLPVLDVSALALVTTLLVSPVAWVGYSLLLLPFFWGQPWSRLLTIAAVLLAIPTEVVLFIYTRVSTPFNSLSWVYTVAVILVLVELLQIHLYLLPAERVIEKARR